MASVYILKWGLVGAGGITGRFAMDLALSTSSRKVNDVAHAIVAVGSRSVTKAKEFIATKCPDGGCAQKEGLLDTRPEAMGSYQEVYNHPVSDLAQREHSRKSITAALKGC